MNKKVNLLIVLSVALLVLMSACSQSIVRDDGDESTTDQTTTLTTTLTTAASSPTDKAPETDGSDNSDNENNTVTDPDDENNNVVTDSDDEDNNGTDTPPSDITEPTVTVTKPVTATKPVTETKPITTAKPVTTEKPIVSTEPPVTEPVVPNFVFPELVLDPELEDKEKAQIITTYSIAKLLTDNFELDFVLSAGGGGILSSVIPTTTQTTSIKYAITDSYEVLFAVNETDTEGNTVTDAVCRDGYLYVSKLVEDAVVKKRSEVSIDITSVIIEMLQGDGAQERTAEDAADDTDASGELGVLAYLEFFKTVRVEQGTDGGYIITCSDIDTDKINAMLLELMESSAGSNSESAEGFDMLVGFIESGTIMYSGTMVITVDKDLVFSSSDFDLAVQIMSNMGIITIPVTVMTMSFDTAASNIGGEVAIELPEDAETYEDATIEETLGMLTGESSESAPESDGAL